MSKLEHIQQEILSLSSDERELISIFIKNSVVENAADYKVAWTDELQRRLTEVQNGTADILNTADVVADIRKKLKK